MKNQDSRQTADLRYGELQMLDSKSQATRRRRRQFSILSLLIAATLFALIVGTWLNLARTQKQAVARLGHLGGRVQYETGTLQLGISLVALVRNLSLQTCGPQTDFTTARVNRHWVTPTDEESDRASSVSARLPQVKRLVLHSLKLGDDDLARLGSIKHQIRDLSINELFHNEFQGSGVRHLGNWPELNSLSVLIDSPSMTEQLDLQAASTNPEVKVFDDWIGHVGRAHL